jgi:hypothetical protein
MNDSLTLVRPERTRRPQPESAALAALRTATLGGTVPRQATVVPLRIAETGIAAFVAPADLIIERLRAGAPALLAHADQATRSRLAQLVIKRLDSMIFDATSVFRLRVGEVASAACEQDAVLLQDAALTIRPQSDALTVEAARALSPAQLLAIIAAASQEHDPDGIDALRCRHVVTSSVDTLAREAMLDLASAKETSSRVVERAVTAHMVRLLGANRLLPTGLLHALAGHGHVAGAHVSTPAQSNDMPPSSPLLRALASADQEASVALLASAAGVSVETVQTAIFLRTGKGLLSLGWRAGLDAHQAANLQDLLGRLPPDEVLRPATDGGFPLTGAEMLWQCRFLGRSQRAFAAR